MEVSLENYFVPECRGLKYYQQLLFLRWPPTYNRHLHRVVIVESFDCGGRKIQQDCCCGLQYIISKDGK